MTEKRKRIEVQTLTRSDLETLAKQTAKLQIIGTLFIGEFQEQVCSWQADGSVEVRTSYIQGSWDYNNPAS